MWMWIAGLVLIAVGVVLFVLRRRQAAKLEQVRATETSTCAQAAELCRSTEGHIGAERAGAAVELKGEIEPRQALEAEISGRECVAYMTRVERRWEEERWETDSEGRRRRRTRRGRDVVAEDERREPFFVRDQTGRVLVDPQDADIEYVETVDHFERGEPEGASLQIGGFRLDLGSIRLGGGRRTIGYEVHEWALPAGERVYVLGGARLAGEEPCIASPSDPSQRFLVSTKSEAEIVRGTRRAVFWLTVGAGVCWAAGLALVAAGLARG